MAPINGQSSRTFRKSMRKPETLASFTEMKATSLRQLKLFPAQTVNVSHNEIESLVGLPRPEVIKNLQASNNCVTKIDEGPFQHCQVLTSLDLSYNSIAKIENLFYLHHLHSLNLAHNRITVVENLEGLVNLRQLNLSDNSINSIFVRSPLPKLVVLDLSGNKFRRLMGLNAFPCLSTLRIDRNKLTTLSGLQKQLNLRRISASNNEIVDFQPFYLPLLSHVDITMNRISSFAGFVRFQSLVRIDISGNPLDDDGLGVNCVFPELKEFRADGTNISDPSLIASIAPNVVVVSLAFAKVSSAANVKLMLSSAKELLSLDLRGNPLNKGCYPDIDGLAFGDKLKEYESEEQYDNAFPETSRQRAIYRKSVLVDCNLACLDGIRIPGKGLKPSKLTFQFVEEIPVDITGEDSASEIANDQEVQCDLSCSSVSEGPLMVERGLQTEGRHKQRLFPPRQTDSTSESGADRDLRRYVNLTDDEDDDVPVRKSPPRPRRHSDESSGSFLSSDSAHGDADFQQLGFGDGFIPISKTDTDSDDENLDNISAATDLDSEIFHVFESPHPARGPRGKRANQRAAFRGDDADDLVRNKGGVAFWVAMPAQQDRRRKQSTNIPPFRNRPQLPRGTHAGHWPFNTKSARRLPWDNEPVPAPEPVWKRKKQVKTKAVRGQPRQRSQRVEKA